MCPLHPLPPPPQKKTCLSFWGNLHKQPNELPVLELWYDSLSLSVSSTSVVDWALKIKCVSICQLMCKKPKPALVSGEIYTNNKTNYH